MTKNIIPKPLPSQFDLRGETMTCYASDNRGVVSYRFNESGYRSDIEYVVSDTYKNKTFAIIHLQMLHTGLGMIHSALS